LSVMRPQQPAFSHVISGSLMAPKAPEGSGPAGQCPSSEFLGQAVA